MESQPATVLEPGMKPRMKLRGVDMSGSEDLLLRMRDQLASKPVGVQPYPEGREKLPAERMIEDSEPLSNEELLSRMRGLAAEQARPTGLFEAMKRGWRRGNITVDMGLLGAEAKDGRISIEEATRRAEVMEKELTVQAPIWSPFEWSSPSTWIPAMVEQAAEFAPFMVRGLFKAQETGLAGAIAGGTGAAIFGQAGPQIALPEEIVTVPITAGVGYSVGATVGFIDFTRQIEGGHLYLKLTREGVPREYALPISEAVGIINGIVEVSQWGRVIKRLPGGKSLFVKAIQSAVTKSPLLLQALGNFAKMVAKDAATEMGEEQIQELTSSGGEVLGHLLKSLKEDEAYQGPEAQEIINRQLETLRQTAGMILIVAPGAALSTLGGVPSTRFAKRVAEVREEIKGKSPADLAARAMGEGEFVGPEIKPPIDVKVEPKKVEPVKVEPVAVSEKARVDKEVADKGLKVRVDEPQLDAKDKFFATQVTLESGTSILVKPGESVEEKVKLAEAKAKVTPAVGEKVIEKAKVEPSEEERLLETIRALPQEEKVKKAEETLKILVPDVQPYEQVLAIEAATKQRPRGSTKLLPALVTQWIIDDGQGAISRERAEELAGPAIEVVKKYGMLTKETKKTVSLEGRVIDTEKKEYRASKRERPSTGREKGLPSPPETIIERSSDEEVKASLEAQSSLSDKAKKRLSEIFHDPIDVALPLVVAPRTQVQLGSQLLVKEGGMELVFLDYDIGGMAFPEDRVIFVSSSAKDEFTLGYLMGHEISHLLGSDLFIELDPGVEKLAWGSYAYRWTQAGMQKQLDRELTKPGAEAWKKREARAYLIGAVYRDERLSRLLRDTNPGIWRRIVDALKDLLRRNIDTLKVKYQTMTSAGFIPVRDFLPLLENHLAELEARTERVVGEGVEPGLPSPLPISETNLSLSESVLLGTLKDDKQLSNLLQARAALRAGQTSFEGQDLQGQTIAGLTWQAWQRASELTGSKPPRGLLSAVLGVEIPELPKGLSKYLQKEGGAKKVHNELQKEYHALADSVFGPKNRSKLARKAFLQSRINLDTTEGLDNVTLYSLIEELQQLEIIGVTSGKLPRPNRWSKMGYISDLRALVGGMQERVSKGEIFPDQIARLVMEITGEFGPIGYRTKWDRTTRAQFKQLNQRFGLGLDRLVDEANLRKSMVANPHLAELQLTAQDLATKRESFLFKGGWIARWMDMRYNMQWLEKLTGLPFHPVYLSLISQHNQAYRQVRKLHERLFEVLPQRLWINKSVSDRIEAYIVEGITAKGMTEQEVRAAEELKKVFEEMKPTVQFLRVRNWIQAELSGNEKQQRRAAIRGEFPNKMEILGKAKLAWLRGQSEGLKAFLAGLEGLATKEQVAEYLGIKEAEDPTPGRMLGVITNKWTPLDHATKRLATGVTKPIKEVGHLLRRGFVEAKGELGDTEELSPTEGDILLWYEENVDRPLLARVQTALLQYHTNEYVLPHVQELQALHREAVRGELYGKHERNVITDLGNFTLDLLNAPTERGPLTDAFFALYNLTAASVFLMPKLVVRNLFQNPAMFPVRRDIARAVLSGPMTERMEAYFNLEVSQIENIKRAFMSIGPQRVPGLGKLVDLANLLSRYAWSDDINRITCFKAAYLGTQRDVGSAVGKDAQGEALSRSRHFALLEPLQQVHALKLLAIGDVEEAMMFVAKEVTNNVNFVYDRASRSPAEHRTVGRLVGNLMTFPRSVAQRYMLMMNQAIRGPNRFYALRRLTNLVVGMWLVGELARYMTRDRENPYHPLKVISWTPGGLQLGIGQETVEMARHLIAACSNWTGDAEYQKMEIAQFKQKLARTPNMMVPFYRILISIVEAGTSKKNLTLLGINEVHAILDSRYKSRKERHEAERTFYESCMHALLANRAGDNPKRGKGWNVWEEAEGLVGAGLSKVVEGEPESSYALERVLTGEEE